LQSRRYVEENILLPIPGIKPRFLSHPALLVLGVATGYKLDGWIPNQESCDEEVSGCQAAINLPIG
jgi:hypothetical protein